MPPVPVGSDAQDNKTDKFSKSKRYNAKDNRHIDRRIIQCVLLSAFKENPENEKTNGNRKKRSDG